MRAKQGFVGVVALCLILIVALVAPTAAAQSVWTSGASDNWSVIANWNNGAGPVPTSGNTADLTFTATGNTSYTATNDLGAFTLNKLTFNNAGTGTITAACTTAVTLGGTNPTIIATGTGPSTLASALVYSAGSTVTNTGAGLLSLNGRNTFSTGTNTIFSGTGNITAGTTSGAGIVFQNNATVTYNGSGEFALADGGTYTGANVNVTLANTGTGIFDIGNMAGLSGTLTIGAGAVRFAGNTGGDLFGNALTLNIAAGATFDFAANGETMGAISGNGIVRGAGITAQVTGIRTWGGSIQGTSGFSNGVLNADWTFTGENTTTGNTTVVASSILRLGNGGTGGSVAANLVDNGSLFFNRSTDLIYGGVISGAGIVTKQGTNTLTLTGASTYTGDTTVSQGVLRVAGSAAQRNYTVADGATLSILNTADTSYAVSSLTLGSDGPTTLAIELNGSTLPTVPVLDVQASLIANAPVNLAVSSYKPLAAGNTVSLVRYSGSIGGTVGAAAFSLVLPPRVTGTLTDTGTSLDLSVTTADTIKWNGNVSGTWDTGTAVNVGGANNFKLASNAASTNFVAGDFVTFDDTAAGNPTVSLPAAVRPAAIVVDTAATYTFQGAGAIAGTAALTKAGAGTLNLLTNNTYLGPTTVTGGTLGVGNGGTTGSLGLGDLVVQNGASVVINRSDDVSYGGAISGTGNLAKSGNNTLTLNGRYALDGTLDVAGGNVSVPLPLGGGTHTITKAGAGPAHASGEQQPVHRHAQRQWRHRPARRPGRRRRPRRHLHRRQQRRNLRLR